MTATTLIGPQRPCLRQILNVVLSLAPLVVVFLGVVSGSNDTITATDPVTTPPLVPAGYAFSVWGLIYGSSFAYAIYQALPRQQDNPLLHQIGWFTASAFLGTTVWLLVAQADLGWLTVVCIVWMLLSLIGAFAALIRARAPRSTPERYLVVLPISVFLGWVTVATVANTAAVLSDYGLTDLGLGAQTWAIVMLLAAAVIGSFVTVVSRGNLWYALTVIWALVGVAVANITRAPNTTIATVAGSMALAVALALVAARAWGGPAGQQRSIDRTTTTR